MFGKVGVLFYKVRTTINSKNIELSGYRYFIYKKDMAQFLNKQGAEFIPLAIQKLDVRNTLIVDKLFDKINLGGK